MPTATDPADEAALVQAQADYLAAIQASREAIAAFSGAPAGAQVDARRQMEETLRRQSAAERAFERARQETRGAPYAGRPRLSRWP